jgi:predicted nucleic acid-binding protein
MPALVVDSSAVAELILSTARGLLVSSELAGGATLHAPDLLGVELVSVLRKLANAGEISSADSARALDDFRALGVEMYEHDPLLDRAFALRGAVSAYDAMFLALAEALDAPLLTCDAKLAGSNGHDATVTLVG